MMFLEIQLKYDAGKQSENDIPGCRLFDRFCFDVFG